MAKMLFPRSEINVPIFDINSVVSGPDSKRKKLKRTHMKWETNKCPFDNCDYVCKSGKQSTKQMHISMKHQFECGIPQNTYTCRYCLRYFTGRGLLNHHIERAHKEWKWKCKECDKLSPNKASYLTHYLSIHKNIKSSDCVNENGCCRNCGLLLPKTGHQYHYAKCIGLHHEIFPVDR